MSLLFNCTSFLHHFVHITAYLLLGLVKIAVNFKYVLFQLTFSILYFQFFSSQIWRLQAALSEQTEITKFSQQEYERLQNVIFWILTEYLRVNFSEYCFLKIIYNYYNNIHSFSSCWINYQELPYSHFSSQLYLRFRF